MNAEQKSQLIKIAQNVEGTARQLSMSRQDERTQQQLANTVHVLATTVAEILKSLPEEK